MGNADGMVRAMLAYEGMSGRPNKVTRAYAARNGSEFLRAAWCDMTVTEAARASDNFAAVCPAGDRAFTVWHAQDFQKRGRWYPGTVGNVNAARPGDVVFFDWGYTDSIGRIDHVGIVIRTLGGGYVETIEGNTGDACKRKERHHSVIAGYGRPAYGTGSPAKPAEKPAGASAPRWPGRYFRNTRPMLYGTDVRTWQTRMKVRGWSITADGWYGAESERVCRAFQAEKRLERDGVVGPATWAAAWTSPVT